MIMKKAFTLTELLIALAVLGLLIAILTPIISNLIPEQNALMAKRSYYAVQTLISDMLNDEACYPDHTQSIYGDQRVGFDDGYGYADCVKWGGVDNPDSIDSENAINKFITLFRNKLDINPNYDDFSSFETRDGIRWSINDNDINTNKNSADAYLTISVDVNGAENPNCSQAGLASATLATGTTCEGRTQDFDIYSIKVYADGKIEIDDNWAIEAVDINKDVTASEEDT